MLTRRALLRELRVAFARPGRPGLPGADRPRGRARAGRPRAGRAPARRRQRRDQHRRPVRRRGVCPKTAVSSGCRPTSCSRSATASACTRRCGRPPTCSRAAGWRSSRGSATRTPNRSHFESMSDLADGPPGPAGSRRPRLAGPRPRRGRRGAAEPAAVHVGTENLPRALFARRATSASFADASDLALALPVPRGEPPQATPTRAMTSRRSSAAPSTSAYATAAELEAASAQGRDGSARYPETDLAQRLDLVARSIKSGSPARVYYLIQWGYDTHAVQLPTHARLLREFAGAVRAFLDDLARPSWPTGSS